MTNAEVLNAPMAHEGNAADKESYKGSGSDIPNSETLDLTNYHEHNAGRLVVDPE